MAISSISRRCVLRFAALSSAALATRAFAFDDDVTPTRRQADAMDNLALLFMADHRIPGFSVAFAHRGRIAYTAGYGLANIDRKQPVNAQTTFRIASISKCFTSAALYTLVEQNKLSLDDFVFGKPGILSHYALNHTHQDWLQSIRVRHLLTHTAGGWSHDAPDPSYMWPDLNQAEMLQRTVETVPLKAAPGTTFFYSNLGFLLLGRVLEARTGTHYGDYVRDHVLKPCGIDTMFLGDALPNAQLHETSYYVERDQPGINVQHQPEIDVHRRDSAGGWVATPSDLVRLALHVDGFPDPPDILQPSSIADMTTPTEANPHYAKGWQVNAAHNWWHSGKLPGTASLLVRTASGLCWAGVTNKTRVDVDAALDNLMWRMARTVPQWHA